MTQLKDAFDKAADKDGNKAIKAAVTRAGVNPTNYDENARLVFSTRSEWLRFANRERELSEQQRSLQQAIQPNALRALAEALEVEEITELTDELGNKMASMDKSKLKAAEQNWKAAEQHFAARDALVQISMELSALRKEMNQHKREQFVPLRRNLSNILRDLPRTESCGKYAHGANDPTICDTCREALKMRSGPGKITKQAKKASDQKMLECTNMYPDLTMAARQSGFINTGSMPWGQVRKYYLEEVGTSPQQGALEIGEQSAVDPIVSCALQIKSLQRQLGACETVEVPGNLPQQLGKARKAVETKREELDVAEAKLAELEELQTRSERPAQLKDELVEQQQEMMRLMNDSETPNDNNGAD